MDREVVKGVSPVVAGVLLLLIVVSLTGFALVFFQRSTETTAEAGEQALGQQVGQLGTAVRLEGAKGNNVYVRNAGGTPIQLSSMSFYVNRTRVAAAGPDVLDAGNLGTYALNKTQLAGLPKVAEVKVTAGDSSDSIIAILGELLARIISMGSVLTTGMVVGGQEDGILFQNSAGNDIAIMTDSGKFGIGTMSPTSGKLQIVSGASTGVYISSNQAADSGSTGWLAFFDSNQGSQIGRVYSDTGSAALSIKGEFAGLRLLSDGGTFPLDIKAINAAPIRLFTNNIERVRVDSTGNVGIGTTAPNSILEVTKAGGTNTVVFLTTYSSFAGHQPYLNLRKSSGAQGVLAQTAEGENLGGIAADGVTSNLGFASAAGIRFVQDAASGANTVNGRIELTTTDPGGGLQTRVTIKSSGNVGIGTASPGAKLHVDGTLMISAAGVEGGALMQGGPNNIRLRSGSGGSIELATRPGGVETPRMTITDGGNVGIGTASPAMSLEVLKATTAESSFNGIRITADHSSATARAALEFYHTFSTDFVSRISTDIGGGGTSPKMYFDVSTGAGLGIINAMVLDKNGNVGIGTASPQSTLQVNGYTQLGLTSGVPPAADCDSASERGRMKVGSAAGLLHICMDSGWVSK